MDFRRFCVVPLRDLPVVAWDVAPADAAAVDAFLRVRSVAVGLVRLPSDRFLAGTRALRASAFSAFAERRDGAPEGRISTPAGIPNVTNRRIICSVSGRFR